MASKKPETVEGPVKTRKVRVHEQRTYVDEEPVIVEETEIDPDESQWSDPFASFRNIVSDSNQATMVIWRLPNYDIDGRTSPNGTEREYCGSIVYRDDDDTMLSQIHARVPQGGTVFLELKERGSFKSSGVLKIAKPNGQPSVQPGQTSPHFTINQPAQQAVQGPTQSATEIVREQFSMLRDMVGVMKELTPPAPVVNVSEAAQQNHAPDERSIGDRIVEAVALKALESKDTPIDRVLEVLGGGKREPSWTESLVPLGLEIVKGLMPAINMGVQAYIRSQAMQAVQVQTGPPAEGGTPNGTGTVPAALPPSPPMDPAERAWRITVRRLLEDCFEHVQISAVSPDGMSVIPASTNIVDLLDRFQNNEQLVAMVNMLLNAEPAEVVDLCAMLQTDEASYNAVIKLKEEKTALAWLKELQEETKKTLSEGGDDGN